MLLSLGAACNRHTEFDVVVTRGPMLPSLGAAWKVKTRWHTGSAVVSTDVAGMAGGSGTERAPCGAAVIVTRV